LFYLSRNVKINARKRKPLKLQTRITASNAAFDDLFVFNVDDEYDRTFDLVVIVVIGIYSISVLVSSVIKFIVGNMIGRFVESIFDLTRTRNADVKDK
jgi:hypothetical protein